MEAHSIKDKAKHLKYKMIYGGKMSVLELLTVIQHSDGAAASLASTTLHNYVAKLELALLEEKMKNSAQLDTGNKVISIKELPEIMQHDILSSIGNNLS